MVEWQDGEIREYLIRGSDDPGAGLGVDSASLARVLTPTGWTTEPVDGWGDFRIAVAGGEVAFAGEDPGWQVAVYGVIKADDADRIVDRVAEQLAAATGQATRVVPL